jgi:hypothetical protein
MLLFECRSAKNSWIGRSKWRERERVNGYIKETPKAGGRWTFLTENRLSRSSARVFSDLVIGSAGRL